MNDRGEVAGRSLSAKWTSISTLSMAQNLIVTQRCLAGVRFVQHLDARGLQIHLQGHSRSPSYGEGTLTNLPLVLPGS